MSTHPRHKNGNGWFDARLRQSGDLLFSSNARNTFCGIVVFIKQTIFSFSISIFFKNFSAGYFSIQQGETSECGMLSPISHYISLQLPKPTRDKIYAFTHSVPFHTSGRGARVPPYDGDCCVY